MDFNREKLFHIGLTPGQGAAYAIITGDPGRVESIARRLNGARFEAQNREFTTWSGQIGAERVLVTSHGIGGPSTAICVEELARCGVKTLIRVGTCGGMALTVQGGDVVVATGAIRMEGTSREYLPVEFPAVADFTVTGALAAAARKWGGDGSCRRSAVQRFLLRTAQSGGLAGVLATGECLECLDKRGMSGFRDGIGCAFRGGGGKRLAGGLRTPGPLESGAGKGWFAECSGRRGGHFCRYRD